MDAPFDLARELRFDFDGFIQARDDVLRQPRSIGGIEREGGVEELLGRHAPYCSAPALPRGRRILAGGDLAVASARCRVEPLNMTRKARARALRDAAPASDEGAISSDDRAAVITNIWTLTSRSATQIGKTVSGDTTEAPLPALRALFRVGARR
jgi:hypothetical protein